MHTLSNVIKWVVVSSADPTKVSATIKFALLSIIPAVMSVVGLACGFHLTCVNVTPDNLSTIASEISQLAFLGLSAVSILGALWMFCRKVFRTMNGTNAAFAAPQG